MIENNKQEFIPTISKEAINQLPLKSYEGSIHLVHSNEQFVEIMPKLLKEDVFGFDTETRPAFHKGKSYPPALLQLATREAVYLFQLRALEFPKELVAVLSDPKKLKVGVAIHEDIRELQKMITFEPAGFVDLSAMASERDIASNGLRALVAYLLDFRITKGPKTSNWNRETLSAAQISYAATDAWASREVYLALKKIKKKM